MVDMTIKSFPSTNQGRSQDSVNGGAQLGAVTREYNRQRIIVKGVSSGSFIGLPRARAKRVT